MEEAATHVGGAGGQGRRDGRSRAGDAEPLVVLMIRQLSPPLQYMPRVGGGTRLSVQDLQSPDQRRSR